MNDDLTQYGLHSDKVVTLSAAAEVRYPRQAASHNMSTIEDDAEDSAAEIRFVRRSLAVNRPPGFQQGSIELSARNSGRISNAKAAAGWITKPVRQEQLSAVVKKVRR